MKKIFAGLLLSGVCLSANAQDAVSALMGMAQAAVNSPAAKNAVASVVPSSLSRGVVIQGGEIVSGSMPMAITCQIIHPNACKSALGDLPFHKHIFRTTGETSFTIHRIETLMSGSRELVTIHFTLNQ